VHRKPTIKSPAEMGRPISSRKCLRTFFNSARMSNNGPTLAAHHPENVGKWFVLYGSSAPGAPSRAPSPLNQRKSDSRLQHVSRRPRCVHARDYRAFGVI
jgi:hypothetical protein